MMNKLPGSLSLWKERFGEKISLTRKIEIQILLRQEGSEVNSWQSACTRKVMAVLWDYKVGSCS